MRVGFIGLGHMGIPMARNLLARRFELQVQSRTRAKAESLAVLGARPADSIASLTRWADVVLACLSDQSACEDVWLGPGGVMTEVRPGQIVVDHSTVGPGLSRRCHQAARRRGAEFLDAPVSGGPGGAAGGTLTLMVGGDATAYQRVLPIFQAMGTHVFHMGGAGTGALTKLANQILVGVNTVATCEAMLLGTRSGLDPERLLQVLTSAWGASRMLERNAPRIIRREFESSSAPLRHLAKDLGLVVDLEEQMGLSLPATRVVAALNRQAADRGLSRHDIAAIYDLLDDRSREPVD